MTQFEKLDLLLHECGGTIQTFQVIDNGISKPVFYAKELLAECQSWAKCNGCQEFASDCEIDNADSFCFHKAMNFTEVNRIICFTKTL